MFSNPVILQKKLSRRQQEVLVEHLYVNKDLARANFNVPQASTMWRRLSNELNAMGYVRTVEEWQQVWLTWCRKTRLKAINARQSSLASGKEAADVFSYIELLVLEILGIQSQQRDPAAKTNDRAASVTVSSLEAPKHICRLCLSTEKLAPLFGFKEYAKSDTLKLATGLEINMDDGLPQLVCSSCSSLLSSAIKLRQQSHAAAIWLEKYCPKTNMFGPEVQSTTVGNQDIRPANKSTADINKNPPDVLVVMPESSNETTSLAKKDPTHSKMVIRHNDNDNPPFMLKTEVNVNQPQPKISIIKLKKPLLPVVASDLRPNIFTATSGPNETIVLSEPLLHDTLSKPKECSVDVDPLEGVYPLRMLKEETDEYIETTPATEESPAMEEMNTAGGEGSRDNDAAKSSIDYACDDSTSNYTKDVTTMSGDDILIALNEEKCNKNKLAKLRNDIDVSVMEFQDEVDAKSDVDQSKYDARYAEDRNTDNNKIKEHPSTSKSNQKVFKRFLTHRDLLAISKNAMFNDELDLKAIKAVETQQRAVENGNRTRVPAQNGLLKTVANCEGRTNNAGLRNPITKLHDKATNKIAATKHYAAEKNIPCSNRIRDDPPTYRNKNMEFFELNGPTRWLDLRQKLVKDKKYDDPKLREVSSVSLDFDMFSLILEEGDDFFPDEKPPTKNAASADIKNIQTQRPGSIVLRNNPKKCIVSIQSGSNTLTTAPTIDTEKSTKNTVEKPSPGFKLGPLTKYDKLKKQDMLQFLDDSIVNPNTHQGGWKCKCCEQTIVSFCLFQRHCKRHFVSKIKRRKNETKFEILKEHDMLRFLDESVVDPNKHRGDWKCRRCSMTYATFKSFQNHCTIHLERKIVCELCGAMFHNEGKLRWHLRNMHQSQLHCESRAQNVRRRPPTRAPAPSRGSDKAKAPQGSDTDIAWAYERSVHTGRRLYVCEHCGRGFYNRQCINQHLDSHCSDTIFNCKLCRKKYAAEQRKSRRIDRSKTVYDCPVCDKAFLLRSNAVSHLDLAHGLTTSDVKIVARVRDYAEVKRKQQQMTILRRHLRDTSDPLQLPEAEFVKHFRLTQQAYHQVLSEIEPYLPPLQRTDAAANELKLLAALSFYANGTFQRNLTTSHQLGMAQTTVSRSLKWVTNALNAPEVLNRHLKFPETGALRAEIKERFMENFGFPNVLGCVFGTHVAIYCPNEQRTKYLNGKGYYSINALVVCDSSLRILYMDPSFGGSAQDSFVWDHSRVKDILQKLHEDGERCWLLGDSGYAPQPWLLPPIAEAAPNTSEEHYNKCHSAVRSTVDRCVRTLKARWRCLLAQRVLHYHSAKAGKIINACAVLHNIANAHGIPVPELKEEDFQADRERQVQPAATEPRSVYDWQPIDRVVQELWIQHQCRPQ